MHIQNRLAHGLVGVALLATCSAIIDSTPSVTAHGVTITSTTAASPNLFVQWSADEPERIEVIQWNPAGLTGSEPNLTNSGTVGGAPPPCHDGLVEYFGNSWAPPDPPAGEVLVGAGTTRTRTPGPDSKVVIDSIASSCTPVAAGVPVNTTYQFWQAGQPLNRMKVTREFTFATAFAQDFRPYIPRLFPIDDFRQVLHPDAWGTSLITELVGGFTHCPFGCVVANWSGEDAATSWCAIHDPIGGNGMIVRRIPNGLPVALWIDWDGASLTNASSVLLLAPDGGFPGQVSETQFFCFYDRSIWIPSLELPPGC